jgi:hypothetical protein
MPGRIDETIAQLWPQGAPAEVTARRDDLRRRVEETGVGTPPQLTLVCRFG